MYIASKNYENAVKRVKVNVGLELGLDNENEAFITLKELPTMEILKLKEVSQNGGEELLSFFKETLPNIIVDHNLYETEQKKMSNEEVVALVFESMSLTNKVLNDYSQASFFRADGERPKRAKNTVKNGL